MFKQRLNQKTLLPGICFSLMLAFATTFVIAENAVVTSKSYLSFNEKGELVRPTGYREWVYIGTPLTPNAPCVRIVVASNI